jgi:NPCBM/NEW2 domain
VSKGETAGILVALATLAISSGFSLKRGSAGRPLLFASGIVMVVVALTVIFWPGRERSDETAAQPPNTVAPPEAASPTMTETAPPPPGVSQHLADIEPTQKDYFVNVSEPDVTVNGDYARKSIGMHPEQSGDRQTSVIYTIARKYGHLSTAAGISDKSPSGTSFRLQILGDDRELFSQVVSKGATSSIPDLDISGVYELKFVAQGLGQALPFGSDFWTPEAVFLDPVVTQ